MKEILLLNRKAYARRSALSGEIEFQYFEDAVWFRPMLHHWQWLGPKALRAVADLLENK